MELHDRILAKDLDEQPSVKLFKIHMAWHCSCMAEPVCLCS